MYQPTLIAYYDSLRSLNKGYVAGLYGEIYDVRRMDGETFVSLSANFPVLTQFQARIS
jgi:hypothetical protein